MTVKEPAKNPCGSCPYRKNAPSGLWSKSEYDKLPEYDKPTGEQPIQIFMCHQQDDRVCAGWVGCHDMDNALALRFAAQIGEMTPEAWEKAVNYTTTVPLFTTGQEAAEHGMRDIDHPGSRTKKHATRLVNRELRKAVERARSDG